MGIHCILQDNPPRPGNSWSGSIDNFEPFKKYMLLIFFGNKTNIRYTDGVVEARLPSQGTRKTAPAYI